VVVVEDEITSGNTVINCVRALRAAGIECDRVATIYVADDVNLRDRLAAEGLKVHAASSFSRDVGERLRR
jgi:orotate phosphoribosyltransferase